jgi:hypothetical protein
MPTTFLLSSSISTCMRSEFSYFQLLILTHSRDRTHVLTSWAGERAAPNYSFMRSCTDRSSHANTYVLRQHLRKGDLRNRGTSGPIFTHLSRLRTMRSSSTTTKS